MLVVTAFLNGDIRKTIWYAWQSTSLVKKCKVLVGGVKNDKYIASSPAGIIVCIQTRQVI